MASNIKLTYLNIPGLAEFIRLMLNYGDITFEDVRVEREDWPKLKPSTPFGVLPIYEEDGKCVGQSLAIGRYVAKKVNLVGNSEWENLEIDAIIDTVNDFKDKLRKVIAIPKEDPNFEKELKIYTDEVCPFYLERLDKKAKENNGYLVGKRLTWADFYFTAITDYSKDLTEKYEHLKTVRRNVYELPTVKRYVETRPEFDYSI